MVKNTKFIAHVPNTLLCFPVIHKKYIATLFIVQYSGKAQSNCNDATRWMYPRVFSKGLTCRRIETRKKT
jgi:hypothetical protein